MQKYFKKKKPILRYAKTFTFFYVSYPYLEYLDSIAQGVI